MRASAPGNFRYSAIRTLFLSVPVNPPYRMKKFLHSPDGASKGAALIIVLAFVVLVTALAVAHFSRTTTDRQLAQSSFNDTSADLLARSALDITVSDLKQEIANNPTVTTANIQPQRYTPSPSPTATGTPTSTPTPACSAPIPNLIRQSFSGDPTNRTSSISSAAASANGRSISVARWNSHYLIPLANPSPSPASLPVCSFTAPDWVLVTAQGPNSAPAPSAVIGRYAFAVYDEGGLIDINLGGVPTYASLSRPTRPTRRLAAKHPLEESEIMLAACQAPDFTPQNTNASGSTGVPFSITPNTNHNPTSFGPDTLPHGLFVNPITGNIFGIPTSPGSFTVTLSASNGCGTGTGTLNLTINGLPSPDSTPWPVNLARKGTVAFADLTTLPSTPTAITPTTPVGSMGGFPSTAQINEIMGWRNYATTQQTGASFNNPSFPSPAPDTYARYFLGAALPFSHTFHHSVSRATRKQPRQTKA